MLTPIIPFLQYISPTRRLKRISWRAHLPARAQTALWNFEYRRGRWSYLDNKDQSGLTDLIMRYRSDGTILDLGCGTARNFVPPSQFAYHGVDISGEAIRTAQQFMSRANVRFEVADICDYEPSTVYDVIVMREVLYYLPPSAVPKIATRMRDALAPGGILVIQIWNRHIYGSVVDAVKGSQLAVVEQFDRDDGGCIVVLARPT